MNTDYHTARAIRLERLRSVLAYELKDARTAAGIAPGVELKWMQSNIERQDVSHLLHLVKDKITEQLKGDEKDELASSEQKVKQ